MNGGWPLFRASLTAARLPLQFSIGSAHANHT